MMRAFATAVLLLSGCYDPQAYEDLLALNEERASSTQGTTGSTSAASTWPSSVSITDPTRGASEAESDTGTASLGDTEADDSGGDSEGEAEALVYLELTPTAMEVAGDLNFIVEHSAAVERLALFQGDNDTPLQEWLAGEAPPSLLITRGEDELRTFTVRGYTGDDDDVFTTSNEAEVQLNLPSPGTLLWEEFVDVGFAGHGGARMRL